MIPAISLWNPWAFWVASGWKTIETRTHPRLRHLEGKRIAIHAAKHWDVQAYYAAFLYLDPFQIEMTKALENFRSDLEGGVVCTAFVEKHFKTDGSHSKAALIDCGSFERYGLALSGIERVPLVPSRGRQGIFMV